MNILDLTKHDANIGSLSGAVYKARQKSQHFSGRPIWVALHEQRIECHGLEKMPASEFRSVSSLSEAYSYIESLVRGSTEPVHIYSFSADIRKEMIPKLRQDGYAVEVKAFSGLFKDNFAQATLIELPRKEFFDAAKKTLKDLGLYAEWRVRDSVYKTAIEMITPGTCLTLSRLRRKTEVESRKLATAQGLTLSIGAFHKAYECTFNLLLKERVLLKTTGTISIEDNDIQTTVVGLEPNFQETCEMSLLDLICSRHILKRNHFLPVGHLLYGGAITDDHQEHNYLGTLEEKVEVLFEQAATAKRLTVENGAYKIVNPIRLEKDAADIARDSIVASVADNTDLPTLTM